VSDQSDPEPDIVLRLDRDMSSVVINNAEEIRPAGVEGWMRSVWTVPLLAGLVLEFEVPGRGMVRHRLVPVEGPEQRGPAVWGQM
jgi:hypothetical protein